MHEVARDKLVAAIILENENLHPERQASRLEEERYD
jgi:hypothetical protein